MIHGQFSLKNISLAAFALAATLLTQGCGLVSEDDAATACNSLANSTYVTNSEVALNSQELNGSDLAQSFTTGGAISVSKVRLILAKYNNPNGNGTLTVSIEKDAAGSPDNVVMASTFLPISQITQNGQATTLTFAFASNISLRANTKYWVRLSSNIAQQPAAGALVKWMGSPNNPYGSGEAKIEDSMSGAWKNAAIAGTSFSGPNHDLVFDLDCN